MTCYRKASMMQPNSLQICEDLSLALQQQGDFDGAIDVCDRAAIISIGV